MDLALGTGIGLSLVQRPPLLRPDYDVDEEDSSSSMNNISSMRIPVQLDLLPINGFSSSLSEDKERAIDMNESPQMMLRHIPVFKAIPLDCRDDHAGGNSRKKLRLSKEQSALLEESFRLHSTLNPKQKMELANRLKLSHRQVEVWFQNRRARTKLKQTEMECEYLKRCCDALREENRKLSKEVSELRALKLDSPFYMTVPPPTLTMCPSCERIISRSSSSSSTPTPTPTPTATPTPTPTLSSETPSLLPPSQPNNNKINNTNNN